MPTFPVPGSAWGNLHALRLVATTGSGGFTKVNAVPTILSWTAPNDGQLHRVAVFASQHVTVAETGGAIVLFWTAPDGQGANSALYTPTGPSALPPASVMTIVQPGTTVTVVQNSPLTAGAAVLWAELWAL